MKIFDVNLSTGNWPFRVLPLEKLEDLQVKLEVSGISGGIVRSLEAPFSLNICEANEKLASACKDFPQFFIAPAVRPDFGLYREIDTKFAVLYPNYHQYSLLDEMCLEMVEFLLGKNIVPVIAVREEDERGQHPLCKVPPVPVAEVNELASKFPGKPFIVLNCYTGELAKLTAENIYADIAFADGFPALARATEFFAPERMLFGTHAPFFCVNAAVSKLQYEKLDDHTVEKIVYGNIERMINGR
ncbi:MAG: hypothetical protein J6R86_04155 [Lentisphaeria bacterium]|nr:hypothetical protein [Lentisphaeria bacterium]